MVKISRPILYLGLAAICMGAYYMTEPEQAKAKTTKAKPPVTRKADKGSIYTEEDFGAPMPRLAAVEKNTFEPIVARKSALSAMAPDGGVPSDFAGGDPNWVCTGTAEVDGVRMALMENSQSGDALFLKQGDRWKNAVVSEVVSDGIVFAGPGGLVKRIGIQMESDEPEPEVAETTVPPVQVPGFSGPIGPGNMNVTREGGGGGRRGGRMGGRGGGGGGGDVAEMKAEAAMAPPAKATVIEENGN
jgi:hypothetical protein